MSVTGQQSVQMNETVINGKIYTFELAFKSNDVIKTSLQFINRFSSSSSSQNLAYELNHEPILYSQTPHHIALKSNTKPATKESEIVYLFLFRA
jgi:hypothetical protein